MNFMNCALFPHKSCHNCSKCCRNAHGLACCDWTPCRGAHPSTPNPCEGEGEAKAFDLCMPKECQNCENNFLNKE